MAMIREKTSITFAFKSYINASAVTVWKTICTPSILEKCHPFCKENPIKRWPGVGSKDRIIYLNNLILDRHFTTWTENVGYQLVIGRGSTDAATVDWTITPLRKQRCSLQITICCYPSVALNRYPKILHFLIKRFYFFPQMEHYVSSVVKGFQYYIETGNQVTPNQFGNNKMFSS